MSIIKIHYEKTLGENMKIIIVISSFLFPLLMYFSQRNRPQLRWLYHIIALIALVVVGNITALKIYEVLKNEAVYSFQIHSIFQNLIFLITSAYLGVYLIFLLLLVSSQNES